MADDPSKWTDTAPLSAKMERAKLVLANARLKNTLKSLARDLDDTFRIYSDRSRKSDPLNGIHALPDFAKRCHRALSEDGSRTDAEVRDDDLPALPSSSAAPGGTDT